MIKYVKNEQAKAYTSSDSNKVLLELLWGDQVTLLSNTKKNGRYKVKARWAREVYVKASDLGDDPLLEIYFIDVGQGDGVLVVTPDRKHIMVDGGYNRAKQPHGKSAADFIDWKFHVDYGEDTIKIDDMICSHCDADHYGGLWDLLLNRDNKELDTTDTVVDNFYHAGVSWWKTDQKSRFLGEKEDGYLVDLLTGKSSITRGLSPSADLRLQGEWASFLREIRSSGAAVNRLAHNPDKPIEYLPGYEADEDVSIKILGPIERTINGKPGLKHFGSNSQNTNGNSVLLRLDYGRVRVLLTGDLNKKSQQHLLESLKGNILELAADVVKSCHHGSDDCSYSFLQKVNAATTVISSGDDETHAHPRPNIVAASGSSGHIHIEDDEMITPLIYSTEVSRSLKLGDPFEVEYKDNDASDDEVDIRLTDESKTVIKYKRTSSGAIRPSTKQKTMNRLKVVDGIVYGLVNVRTDGNKILCATLNEGSSKWDIKTFYSRF